MNQMNPDDNFLLLKIVIRNTNKIFNGKSLLNRNFLPQHWIHLRFLTLKNVLKQKKIIIQLNEFYNCAEHRASNGHYFFPFIFNGKTSFFACDTGESTEQINSHLIHWRQTQPPTQTHFLLNRTNRTKIHMNRIRISYPNPPAQVQIVACTSVFVDRSFSFVLKWQRLWILLFCNVLCTNNTRNLDLFFFLIFLWASEQNSFVLNYYRAQICVHRPNHKWQLTEHKQKKTYKT